MPIYEWRCTRCGFIKETTRQYLSENCPQCGDSLRRRFSFNAPAPNCFFQPHFNYSVGEYVTSRQDFADKLHRKGDAMSERLGIDHDYQPHDHGDRVGVTDDD